jgi:hypothetical protein
LHEDRTHQIVLNRDRVSRVISRAERFAKERMHH